MFGRKEIIEIVSEVQAGMEEMRSEVTLMVGTMKSYYEQERKEESQATAQRLKVLEQRICKQIDNVAKGQSSNVTKAMDEREHNKEREELRQEIINKLSVLYAEAQESELFTEGVQGGKKLTKQGDQVYKSVYEVVMLLAKYHGSKSHMKIANNSVYSKFKESAGLTYELTKRVITFSDGRGQESVFADMFHRGIIGKYARFLESEFL